MTASCTVRSMHEHMRVLSFNRAIRCTECGSSSIDDRWAPFCPACYERLCHEQRRGTTRPLQLEPLKWEGRDVLDERFDAALGADLP